MKKLAVALAVIFAFAVLFVLAAAAFAADPAAATAALSGAGPVIASSPAAPALAAAPTLANLPALSALPALPASHDVGSIILWIIGVLTFLAPWFGWLSSELMAVFPGCKWNGWLHGLLDAFGAFGRDDASNSVTVRLDKLESAVAEFKATPPATSTVPAPATLGTGA